MNGLLADGWFYISTAGLLVSGVLFFFLLGQYRAAADAADGTQAAAEPDVAPSPVRPIYIPDEPAAAPKVASAPSVPPAESPKPEPVIATPTYLGTDRRRENTTGGISPAVVYLQNIKAQLEGLHGQVSELAKRVESVTSRDEALIERLGELAHAVEALKTAAPAAEKEAEAVPAPAVLPAPAPAAAPVEMKLELGPAPASLAVKSDVPAPAKDPVPVVAAVPAPEKAPEPEPAPKPSPEPDATIRLEPGDIFKALEPAPEKAEAAEADKPSRRGPVWPV